MKRIESMDPDLLKRRLEALGAEVLASFIADLQQRDPVLDFRIHALASRRQPQRLELLENWLMALIRPDETSSFPWEENGAVLAEAISSFLEAVEVLLIEDQPAQVLAWIEELIAAAADLFSRVIDDSGWLVAEALSDAGLLWLRVARQIRKHKESDGTWGGRLFQLRQKDEYSVLDHALLQSSILLEASELQWLAKAYEQQAMDAVAGRGERGYAALFDLGLIAKALRDPELYAHSVTLKSETLSEAQLEEIAQCYLDLDDPEGALSWLGGDWNDEPTRLVLCAKAYEALEDQQRLLEMRRKLWKVRPHRETLKAYLKLLSPPASLRVREEAAKVAQESELTLGLELLLFLEQAEDAEALLLHRFGEGLIGAEELASQFESARRPLAVVVLYRELLDEIVDAGRSRAYRHAARYYRKLEEFAPRITDWQGLDLHSVYLSKLWARNARKSAFWSRVGGRPQGVGPTS